jgi:hypothetical protein
MIKDADTIKRLHQSGQTTTVDSDARYTFSLVAHCSFCGAVAFTPVADWEDELRRWIARQGIDDITDISESEFGKRVLEEFLDQSPLYPESPQLADENPLGEQGPGEDLEHY